MKYILLNTANNLFVSRVSASGNSYVGHTEKHRAFSCDKRIDAEREIAKSPVKNIRIMRVAAVDVAPIADQLRHAIKKSKRWVVLRIVRRHRAEYDALTPDEQTAADDLCDMARESL